MFNFSPISQKHQIPLKLLTKNEKNAFLNIFLHNCFKKWGLLFIRREGEWLIVVICKKYTYAIAICLDLNNYFDLKVSKRGHPLTSLTWRGEGKGHPNDNGTSLWSKFVNKVLGVQNRVYAFYGCPQRQQNSRLFCPFYRATKHRSNLELLFTLTS